MRSHLPSKCRVLSGQSWHNLVPNTALYVTSKMINMLSSSLSHTNSPCITKIQTTKFCSFKYIQEHTLSLDYHSNMNLLTQNPFWMKINMCQQKWKQMWCCPVSSPYALLWHASNTEFCRLTFLWFTPY
jgi:hypothetical protein